jgi:hypothetical protein
MTDSDETKPACASPETGTDTAGAPKTTLGTLREFIAIAVQRTLETLGNPVGSKRSSTRVDFMLDTQEGTAKKKHRHYQVDVTVAVSDGDRPDCSCDPAICCPCAAAGICTCDKRLGKCKMCSICCPVCHPFPVDCLPWWRRWCTQRVIVALVILTLLALLLWLLASHCQPSDPKPSPPSAPITQTTTAPTLPPPPPAIVRDPTPGSTAQVTSPIKGTVICDGLYHDVDRIPHYALDHAWRQEDAVKWSVKCGTDMSATVIARDASDRAQSIQVFGPNNQYEYQWALSYGAGFVQVDRYEPFMAIVGRTNYRFDKSGRVYAAYRADGHLSPLMEAAIERDGQGRITAVVVSKTPLAGGGSIRYTDSSQIATALGVFYLFETFNEPSH